MHENLINEKDLNMDIICVRSFVHEVDDFIKLLNSIKDEVS